MTQQQWWWCLLHQRVEPDDGCPNAERLGPFATEADAANALQVARERNEAWRREDADWNGES